MPMIELKISKNKVLLGLYLSLYLCAMFILLWLAKATAFPALLSLVLALYTTYHVYHTLKKYYFLSHACAIMSLALDNEGIWWLSLGSGDRQRAEILPHSLLTSGVALLDFKISSSKKRVGAIVVNDRSQKSMYRKLAVWWHYERKLNAGK